MRQPHRRHAALLAAALTLTTGAAADDAKIEGAAAWQALVGNTVVTTAKTGSYTEYYEPGGTLRRMDGDGTTKGQWTVTEGRVCLDYPEDDDHVCLRVTVQGSSGSFTDPDGAVDPFQVLPGNPKGL